MSAPKITKMTSENRDFRDKLVKRTRKMMSTLVREKEFVMDEQFTGLRYRSHMDMVGIVFQYLVLYSRPI